MKLLVFAHTPPPHHGQSYMVKLMLDGFGGDRRKSDVERRESPAPPSAPLDSRPSTLDRSIACYHVNARYSEDLEDIGEIRFGKAMLVLRYCLEAIWCRFRYGLDAFYYVPAPGKRAALYRDWIVMLLCRPFFRHFIHHWHAVGLGDWLREHGSRLERWITHRLLGRPTLGLALAIPSMRDALWFRSERVEIVANGIPDPCPDFDETVLPRRKARLGARRQLLAGEPPTDLQRAAAGDDPECFHVLFLAHCQREKGLFDAVDGVARANAALRASHSPVRLHLTIAGQFPREDEEAAFHKQLASAALQSADPDVTYAGFVSGEKKAELLRTCDCLCFPTFYPAEGQPVSLLEALAVGMHVVTTRWRAIPEILPADFPGFVAPHSPEEISVALRDGLTRDCSVELRERFLALFTERRHVDRLRAALETIAASDRAA